MEREKERQRELARVSWACAIHSACCIDFQLLVLLQFDSLRGGACIVAPRVTGRCKNAQIRGKALAPRSGGALPMDVTEGGGSTGFAAPAFHPSEWSVTFSLWVLTDFLIFLWRSCACTQALTWLGWLEFSSFGCFTGSWMQLHCLILSKLRKQRTPKIGVQVWCNFREHFCPVELPCWSCFSGELDKWIGISFAECGVLVCVCRVSWLITSYFMTVLC